jgi:5-methylcytosine-specific restriction endonuclease McrA
MDAYSCPTCDRTFTSKRGLRVHHAQVHGESLPNRECACCETAFYCEHEKKYCSKDCREQSVSFSGSDNPNYQGGRTVASCRLCGDEFEYYPSEKPGLYCPSCVDGETWQTLPEIDGADNPRWGGGKQTVTCDICDTVVKRWPSEITDVTLCGRACRSKWLSETFAGENHPNWTDTEELAYGSGWDRIRRQAVKRDGYRCSLCGTTRDELGQNPDVHHIVPVRWFVEADGYTRTDAHRLENVIALCRSCHRQAEDEIIPRALLKSLIRDEMGE